MECIPNYDKRKMNLPDDPEPKAHCNHCGEALYEGEVIYAVDGGICESCLNDNYRSFV